MKVAATCMGTKLVSEELIPLPFFYPWLLIFVYSWFEWLHNFKTVHLVLTWFFFCSQLWLLTAGFIPGQEVAPFWTFFRLLGSTWAILPPLASPHSERGSGFSVEMDQAWIFRDCHLHGHHCWHISHPDSWVLFTPSSHRIAAEEIFVHEKINRQRQDSLEGITHSCLLRQKMDLEYSRRDQLCLWFAHAEWRVLSEFTPSFSRVLASKVFRAWGWMER